MIDPNKLNRIKKIYRLSEEGVGGEQVVAKQLLEKLMSKYDLTIEDIKGEEIFEFKYSIKKDKELKTLFEQVLWCMLTYDSAVKTRLNDYRGYNFTFFCTQAENVDLIEAYIHYKKEFLNEKKMLLDAFIIRHRLWSKDKQPTSEKKKLTPKELEEVERLIKMAGGMSSTEFDNIKKLK